MFYFLSVLCIIKVCKNAVFSVPKFEFDIKPVNGTVTRVLVILIKVICVSLINERPLFEVRAIFIEMCAG